MLLQWVERHITSQIKHFQYHGVLYGRLAQHNIIIDFSLALQLPVPASWKNNLITILMKLSPYTDRHLLQRETISMTTYLKNAVFYKRD